MRFQGIARHIGKLRVNGLWPMDAMQHEPAPDLIDTCAKAKNPK
jgi:hypothetical protein